MSRRSASGEDAEAVETDDVVEVGTLHGDKRVAHLGVGVGLDGGVQRRDAPLLDVVLFEGGGEGAALVVVEEHIGAEVARSVPRTPSSLRIWSAAMETSSRRRDRPSCLRQRRLQRPLPGLERKRPERSRVRLGRRRSDTPSERQSR
jgi:hypothetical protein